MSKVNLDIFVFDELIQATKDELESCKYELSNLPKGFLSIRKQYYDTGIKNHIRYCYVENNIRQEKLVTEEDPVVSALARKRFLKKKESILNRNIKFLNKASTGYIDPTFTNVVESLPQVYASLNSETFLSNMSKECIEWMNEPYEKADGYTRYNNVPTSLGIKVKSKTERDIIESLLGFGIPVRYEEVIYIDSHRIAPDVSCMSPSSGKLFYWEHYGKMDNYNYRRNFRWKMEQFEKVGIYPGKNLIITFEGDGQFLSTAEINEIIKSKIL